MKQFILKNKKAITGIAAVLLIGGATMSFQDSGFFNQGQAYSGQDVTDTVPDKYRDGHMKMKDLDKLDAQLEKALSDVSRELKNINFGDMEKTIASSLKAVDVESILKTVESSLKDIDMEKIMADVTTSLKSIDWEKHEGEIKEALKDAKDEIEKAKDEIKKIDMDEIKKEMDNARQELEKSRTELKNIDMDKIMKDAKEGIDKGREELKQLKTMIYEMEKDGLVDTKAGFTLEYKDKSLYINGKKQSEQVSGKYRKYIHDDDFKITIDKE